jgi:hypothetical protein
VHQSLRLGTECEYVRAVAIPIKTTGVELSQEFTLEAVLVGVVVGPIGLR